MVVQGSRQGSSNETKKVVATPTALGPTQTDPISAYSRLSASLPPQAAAAESTIGTSSRDQDDRAAKLHIMMWVDADSVMGLCAIESGMSVLPACSTCEQGAHSHPPVPKSAMASSAGNGAVLLLPPNTIW